MAHRCSKWRKRRRADTLYIRSAGQARIEAPGGPEDLHLVRPVNADERRNIRCRSFLVRLVQVFFFPGNR